MEHTESKERFKTSHCNEITCKQRSAIAAVSSSGWKSFIAGADEEYRKDVELPPSESPLFQLNALLKQLFSSTSPLVSTSSGLLLPLLYVAVPTCSNRRRGHRLTTDRSEQAPLARITTISSHLNAQHSEAPRPRPGPHWGSQPAGRWQTRAAGGPGVTADI
eukprot:752431-Hanusia_phi.AAC.4